MGKFKRTDPYAKLSDAQKAFITAKVRELGTMARVKQFYNKKVTVDQFALAVTKKIYEEG